MFKHFYDEYTYLFVIVFSLQLILVVAKENRFAYSPNIY